MKIGLISDTHGFLDERVFHHFKDCDEIWHAGDIGENGVLRLLDEFKPLKAVFGNIDTVQMQKTLPEYLLIEHEGIKALMIHIGGKPRRYAKGIKSLIQQHNPQLFICGHSHILKVMMDKEMNVLYMNPGAAGKHGFHQMRTLLRFELINGDIKNLEVIELGKRAQA
ncbi:metallophosphoesterase family protein [Roseivirga sp.]|uniref:metallophosphoesterase family protein n=1 Tax=Roseivirga sp. TaxID=1964215 RepID=UPI003B51D995